MLKPYMILVIIAFSSLTVFCQANVRHVSCEPVRTDAIFGKSPDGWNLYLKQAVSYNIPLINCAPAGKYYVEVWFLIGKDGKIEQVRPRSKKGYGMEEELMRAIWLSPPWKAATQNGRAVRTYQCETFIFEVNQTKPAWL